MDVSKVYRVSGKCYLELNMPGRAYQLEIGAALRLALAIVGRVLEWHARHIWPQKS